MGAEADRGKAGEQVEREGKAECTSSSSGSFPTNPFSLLPLKIQNHQLP